MIHVKSQFSGGMKVKPKQNSSINRNYCLGLQLVNLEGLTESPMGNSKSFIIKVVEEFVLEFDHFIKEP